MVIVFLLDYMKTGRVSAEKPISGEGGSEKNNLRGGLNQLQMQI